MPEETQDARDEQSQQQQQGDLPNDLEGAHKLIQALQKRVGERDATIDELKGQQQSLSQRMAEIEQGRQKQLEEQGNYKSLAEERAAQLAQLQPYQERATALEKIIRESNEARLRGIPENMRALVPTEYAPEKLQAWLNANEKLLTNPAPPQFGAGAGSATPQGQPQLTSEEMEMAKRFGLSEEDVLKAKNQRGNNG